jgi:hypothetical protein
VTNEETKAMTKNMNKTILIKYPSTKPENISTRKRYHVIPKIPIPILVFFRIFKIIASIRESLCKLHIKNGLGINCFNLYVTLRPVNNVTP